MISPISAVLTRLARSAWRTALVAALIASCAEFYSLELAS